MANIGGMRQPYHGIESIFDLEHLKSGDPIVQFEDWFEGARKIKEIHEANAMALATATKDGRPSVRMLLMKGYGQDGFRFFTNYKSRKAIELEENPRCSLMFYWEPIKRSVRIEGIAEVLPDSESLEYFDTRPKDSKIGAIVSQQSTVIQNRQVLTEKNKELQDKYKDTDTIPKPDYWGGYLVKPDIFEFWQGQTNRLHDRIRYRKLKPNEQFDEKLMHKGEGDWVIERLSS